MANIDICLLHVESRGQVNSQRSFTLLWRIQNISLSLFPPTVEGGQCSPCTRYQMNININHHFYWGDGQELLYKHRSNIYWWQTPLLSHLSRTGVTSWQIHRYPEFHLRPQWQCWESHNQYLCYLVGLSHEVVDLFLGEDGPEDLCDLDRKS